MLDMARLAHPPEHELQELFGRPFTQPSSFGRVGLAPTFGLAVPSTSLRLEAMGQSLRDEGIEPIFHSILGSTRQTPRDLGPLVAYALLRVQQYGVLVRGPVRLHDSAI